MDALTARSIITQAQQTEAYEDPVPEDDAKAISEAQRIVDLAQAAWKIGNHGAPVEAVLRMADPGWHPNGDVPDTPTPKEEAPSEQKEEPVETEIPVSDDDLDPEDPANWSKIEPWGGYDADKLADIYKGIEAAVETWSVDECVDLLESIQAYEKAHKDRIRVLNKVVECLDEIRRRSPEEFDDGSPEEKVEVYDPKPEVESEAEEVRVPEDTSDVIYEPSDVEAPIPAPETPPQEDRDEIYRDLIADVERQIKREHLHVPLPLPEGEIPELPFDLTTLSDRQLQFLYGAFVAYQYRAGYLLLLEEAKGRRCKEAADSMHRDFLVIWNKYDEKDKEKRVAVIEAEIESDANLQVWRRRQRLHETFAQSYRNERDSYNKIIESLSRLETMRMNEFERSGGLKKRSSS